MKPATPESRATALAAKHADELAKLVREEALRAAIPASVPTPDMVHAHTPNYASVCYEVKTLRAAHAIHLAYRAAGLIVPALYYSARFHHWEPDAMIDARKHRAEYETETKHELETIAELSLTSMSEGGQVTQGTAVLAFWVNPPGAGCVRIDCRIGGYHPPYGLAMQPRRQSGAHNAAIIRWDDCPAVSPYAHQSTRIGTGRHDKRNVDARYYWCFDAHEFDAAIEAIATMLREEVTQ
jgi:hypothetical protein